MSHQTPPYPTRQYLKSWGLTPKKSLGQNFLLNDQVVSRMVQLLDHKGTPVLEVGPGPGALTWALVTQTKNKIQVVEKDAQFQPILEKLNTMSQGRLSIVQEDFFKTTLPSAPFYAVGNLPYNVSSQIIFHFLAHDVQAHKMVFMLQKEVADRIVALPHTGAYGRLSVMLQWCCQAQKLFDVPPEDFWPAPKVTSTVVLLVPQMTEKHRLLMESMDRVVKTAFSQRRKMLRQSIKALCPEGPLLLEKSGINPESRAENLTVAEFERLALCFKELGR